MSEMKGSFALGPLLVNEDEGTVAFNGHSIELPESFIGVLKLWKDDPLRRVRHREIEKVYRRTEANGTEAPTTKYLLMKALKELEIPKDQFDIYSSGANVYRLRLGASVFGTGRQPVGISTPGQGEKHTDEPRSGSRIGRTPEGKKSSFDSIKGLPANATRCPILTREQLNDAIGTIEYRLKHAAEEVWVSGNDNMLVAKALSPSIVRALKSGIKIKILGVDPDSPAASMLAIIDPRFEGGTFKREVDSVTEAVRDLYGTYPNFEYKLLPILPAVGYFITDPKLESKTVKIELYTAQPWIPIDSRPQLVIDESMPDWRDYFIQQFKNYWKLGKTPW